MYYCLILLDSLSFIKYESIIYFNRFRNIICIEAFFYLTVCAMYRQTPNFLPNYLFNMAYFKFMSALSTLFNYYNIVTTYFIVRMLRYSSLVNYGTTICSRPEGTEEPKQRRNEYHWSLQFGSGRVPSTLHLHPSLIRNSSPSADSPASSLLIGQLVSTPELN